MGNESRKTGKKHRKYGRGLRKPAHTRYNSQQRWEENKAKRIAKQKRKEAKKAAKLAERKKASE